MNIARFLVALVSALTITVLSGPAGAQSPPTSNAQSPPTNDPSPATSDAQSSATSNVTGNWKIEATGPKFRTGTYQFTQVNETVIGVNPNGGQIQGTVAGDREIDGKWRGPTGETGWFRFFFTADGKSFSGEYGYKKRKQEGQIIGRQSP